MVELSSYKLLQFLKKYINSKKIETLVVICFYIIQTWPCKLGFVYKKVCKNVFINHHEQPDVVEDQNCFFTKIEELKLYIVEFNKNGAI